MKSNSPANFLRRGVKLIYEFIDTGIFFFIPSVSIFFNLILETVIFYGLIGLILSTALYVFLLKTVEHEDRN